MTLSICICTILPRYDMLQVLLKELNRQVVEIKAEDEVEILVNDSRVLKTGAKRNALYKQAKGKYICSVDDDDRVFPYYVSEILKAVTGDPDAVAMNGIMTTNGVYEQKWFISKDNKYEPLKRFDGSYVFSRYHNHLSPIRAEIARKYPFKNQTLYEDFDFATRIHLDKAIKTEVAIGTTLDQWMHSIETSTPEKPMYHYKYIRKR